MGTGGMGHMDNGAYGTIRYRGMGHMGNGNTWGSRVQWYVVQQVSATWAMGAHGAIGVQGYGVQVWAIGAYGAIGYRGMGYRAHGQWIQGVWATWTIEYKGFRV